MRLGRRGVAFVAGHGMEAAKAGALVPNRIGLAHVRSLASDIGGPRGLYWKRVRKLAVAASLNVQRPQFM